VERAIERGGGGLVEVVFESEKSGSPAGGRLVRVNVRVRVRV
jgi:hypothetical protein